MEEIHISEIPVEIADNVETYSVLVCDELRPVIPICNAGEVVQDHCQFKIKTYQIIRG